MQIKCIKSIHHGLSNTFCESFYSKFTPSPSVLTLPPRSYVCFPQIINKFLPSRGGGKILKIMHPLNYNLMCPIPVLPGTDLLHDLDLLLVLPPLDHQLNIEICCISVLDIFTVKKLV